MHRHSSSRRPLSDELMGGTLTTSEGGAREIVYATRIDEETGVSLPSDVVPSVKDAEPATPLPCPSCVCHIF